MLSGHDDLGMRIGIITPAPPRSTYGNRITALRWARILKALGHRVTISNEYKGEPHDLLLALHARRSYSSIRRFHNGHPASPVIVALTGWGRLPDQERSKAAGFDFHLVKPVDPALLARLLSSLPSPSAARQRALAP